MSVNYVQEIRDGEVFGPDCKVCGAATTKGKCLSCGTVVDRSQYFAQFAEQRASDN